MTHGCPAFIWVTETGHPQCCCPLCLHFNLQRVCVSELTLLFETDFVCNFAGGPLHGRPGSQRHRGTRQRAARTEAGIWRTEQFYCRKLLSLHIYTHLCCKYEIKGKQFSFLVYFKRLWIEIRFILCIGGLHVYQVLFKFYFIEIYIFIDLLWKKKQILLFGNIVLATSILS